MASNWKFYRPVADFFAATATATVGTSANLANILEPHRTIHADIDTVTGNSFVARYDFAASITADCVALVEHNTYTARNTPAAATLTVSHAATSGGIYTGVASAFTIVAADEPIFLETFSSASDQYWKLDFDDVLNTLYCGFAFLGKTVETSVDPNWEQPIKVGIEEGRIVTTMPDGFNQKVREYGVKRGWQVKYQLLNDADETIMRAWLEDSDLVDLPFVFTKDGGTTFQYGELIGDPEWIPQQQGLHDLMFTISEVIA